MTEEDLLVTNAFYPIAILTDTDNTQSVSVDYKFNRIKEIPYKTEQLGSYPNINLRNEKIYDTKTTGDFKKYLKKNGTQKYDFDIHTNADFLDTKLERGNLPQFYQSTDLDRTLKIKKYNINFDSRFRNSEEFPDANNYILPLPFTIYNIKYIKLTSFELPYTNTTTFPYMYVCSKALHGSIKTQHVDNIFAKIQLNISIAGNNTVFNQFNEPTLTIFDDAPLSQLSAIDIQLINPDGTYYVNLDNSFSLEFTTYIDTIVNSNISSRRGVQDKSNVDNNLLLSK